MSVDDVFGQDFARRLADTFRLYVGEPGEGKRFTRAALADATGINPSSLKGYVRGETAIPAHALLRLIRVLPAPAGNMLIENTGYRLVPRDTDDIADWHDLGAEASMLTFEIFEAEKDGKIDHREKLNLKKRARTLAAKAEGLAQ